MNIQTLIDTLMEMPEDTMLYDGICTPEWYLNDKNDIVLAGVPCPKQTVKQLVSQLKALLFQDYPSEDISFRRRIDETNEIHQVTVIEVKGLPTLTVEPITTQTVRSWRNYSNDHMAVNVAMGTPSYILSSDKVTVLVNKTYYRYLGPNGKRKYLRDLLYVRSFTWQTDMGDQRWFNEKEWNSHQGFNDETKPRIELARNLGSLGHVGRQTMEGYTYPERPEIKSTIQPTNEGKNLP